MTEVREHELTKDCWCNPEVFPVTGRFFHHYQLPELLNDVGEGWLSILYKLHKQLWAIDRTYDVAQVKEKFGGLRVYLNYGEERVGVMDECESAIRQAEEVAERTCERCGAPAPKGPRAPEGRPYGWIKTLCDEHHTERT